MMTFWIVTFSAYGSVFLEFFQTAISETNLRKKQPSSFRKHKLIIFTSCLSNLVENFQ